MAAGPITLVSDVIVPSIFTPYVQQITEEKTRIIASGAMVRSAQIDALLRGGGLTFNIPSWKDLDSDDSRVSTDTASAEYSGGTASPVPKKVGSAQEIAVRMHRNQSWSTSDLAASLAGSDPMAMIGTRVGTYWARELQKATVALVKGVFADNAAAPSGTEHTQDDLTVDISGVSYSDGVTTFSASAFIDAKVTAGDSMNDLSLVMVHSVVYAKMLKNNLIDFIPDASGTTRLATFMGHSLIVDDSMPVSSGVYDTWLFGAGALQLGVNTPKNATEMDRLPGAGNGGGEDTLYNRVEWCLHPTGHKYAGTAANGGPSNANSSNNLAHAGSWQRVYAERKMIKIARLITRES